MSFFIDNLPGELVYYNVLPYLDESFNDLEFISFIENNGPIYPYVNNNYGLSYQCARNGSDNLLRKQVIYNDNIEVNFLISRIVKKNKKFRFYLTIEKNFLEICRCGDSYCSICQCGIPNIDYTNYSSVYVKNSLYLFIWWSTITKWQQISFPLCIKNKISL